MDKWLDQLTDSKLFMKLVALLLALLLFGTVYDSSKDTNEINVPGSEQSEIIPNIPVKSYYDTDNLVITGVPETVEVTLKGPTPNLQVAKTQKDFEVYADLSDVKVGKQRVKLQIRNLSDKLKATINPDYVEVNVQEKVTKEYTIDAEFNHKLVADGYEAGAPVVKPNKVKITGGKDVMDKISYVKAIIDINKTVNDTIDESARVTVLDENLNKLNVIVDHEVVNVTVPIKKLSKTVKIDVVEKGAPAEGVTIESITLDTNEATISANQDILDKTEAVRVEVDVSSLKESTDLTLPVIISDEIKEVTPKTVKATVKISSNSEETSGTEVETTKTLAKLPIRFIGLPENYHAVFRDPASGSLDLTITGKESVLTGINESDFQLSVNVAELSVGEHKVKLDVKGPENVTWTSDINTITVAISEKQQA
ncbi:CdaR family protein [Bacillus tuaregi]|uniref:CdaR family protein n=1 Tax=Bacillus tuaregi TaxID=1816695 RepID=UPI0008F89111|nr:CdaR family protein [Bacillus tuaregi]